MDVNIDKNELAKKELFWMTSYHNLPTRLMIILRVVPIFPTLPVH